MKRTYSEFVNQLGEGPTFTKTHWPLVQSNSDARKILMLSRKRENLSRERKWLRERRGGSQRRYDQR